MRGTLLRIFLRIGEVGVRVKRLRGCVDFGGQRVDFGCDGVALVLLVGKTFKIGELLQQFLLLVSADCVIDDLRKIGRVVANPMRGLKISASLTVIAVIVVFSAVASWSSMFFAAAAQESKFVWLSSAAIADCGTTVVAKSVVNAISNAAMNATRRPNAPVARCVSQDDIRPLPLSAVHNPIRMCAIFAVRTCAPASQDRTKKIEITVLIFWQFCCKHP